MTPAQLHMHVQELVNAGNPPIMTVADPGVHGEVVTGMHGIGVSTPRAAAVAEATDGLAMEEHMPNVGMFVMGMKSMMVAAGDVALTLFAGVTIREAGATPKEQVIIAPLTMFWAICLRSWLLDQASTTHFLGCGCTVQL